MLAVGKWKDAIMAYVDGFVFAVADDRRAEFIAHAEGADRLFLEHGATRVMECWGDDVQTGKLTDFPRAVQATDGETVVFAWVEWPDKAARDTGMAAFMADPRLETMGEMPFDGKRMIFGGFTPVVALEAGR